MFVVFVFWVFFCFFCFFDLWFLPSRQSDCLLSSSPNVRLPSSSHFIRTKDPFPAEAEVKPDGVYEKEDLNGDRI